MTQKRKEEAAAARKAADEALRAIEAAFAKRFGLPHSPVPTAAAMPRVSRPVSQPVRAPTGNNCPGPYDDCTQARCCNGGEDSTGMPIWVCSTLVLPSTQYRCYHMKEISEYGDFNSPVSTKIKAQLKSEVSSIILSDDE